MVPTFKEDAFDKNMEVVRAIGAVTEQIKKKQPEATQAQVVLAWLLRQWEGIIPLAGTRSVSRAKENFGGDSVTLSDEDDAAIRKAAEGLKKIGDRYPGGMQEQLNADTPEL